MRNDPNIVHSHLICLITAIEAIETNGEMKIIISIPFCVYAPIV
jgi:hypothetical protein